MIGARGTREYFMKNAQCSVTSLFFSIPGFISSALTSALTKPDGHLPGNHLLLNKLRTFILPEPTVTYKNPSSLFPVSGCIKQLQPPAPWSLFSYGAYVRSHYGAIMMPSILAYCSSSATLLEGCVLTLFLQLDVEFFSSARTKVIFYC